MPLFAAPLSKRLIDKWDYKRKRKGREARIYTAPEGDKLIEDSDARTTDVAPLSIFQVSIKTGADLPFLSCGKQISSRVHASIIYKSQKGWKKISWQTRAGDSRKMENPCTEAAFPPKPPAYTHTRIRAVENKQTEIFESQCWLLRWQIHVGLFKTT